MLTQRSAHPANGVVDLLPRRVSNRASNPPSRDSGVRRSSSTCVRSARCSGSFPANGRRSPVDLRHLDGLSGFCDFDGRDVWETCEENSRSVGTNARHVVFLQRLAESVGIIGFDWKRLTPRTSCHHK